MAPIEAHLSWNSRFARSVTLTVAPGAAVDGTLNGCRTEQPFTVKITRSPLAAPGGKRRRALSVRL